MAGTPTVFGQKSSASTVKSIMDPNSPILRAMPSPQNPENVPNDELKKAYSLLDYNLQQVRKLEQQANASPDVLAEIEKIALFTRKQLQAIVGVAKTEGAPVPSLHPVPPPMPPAPAGPPGAAPAAIGAPAPGGAPIPTPPGAPPPLGA